MCSSRNCLACAKEFQVTRVTKSGKETGRPQKYCSHKCQTRAAARKEQQSNPERVRERRRNFRKNNPTSAKNSQLKKRFGITRIEWAEMFEAQLGICANTNCSNLATDTDHCHDTGAVRAILCSACNKSLGIMKEDAERLQGLALYAKGVY